MSHRTGIKCNSELIKFFGKSLEKTRLIKISIENDEVLALSTFKEAKKDWQSDFDLIVKEIQEDVPCYVLYRLNDVKNNGNYQWLLICWVPDIASIRQKMIYASTKSTLKTEFGTGLIKQEYHATQLDEMTLKGYMKNQEFLLSPSPLTQREEELKELQRTEIKADIGTHSRTQMMGSSIVCPINENALKAINEMKKGIYNYLQFEIDLEKEEIGISKKETIEVAQLKLQIPPDHARFHLFLFKHSYESDYNESFIFIYTMPGYKCSVKERMMYSSCKNYFIDAIQSGTMGLDIAKKLEVDDVEELSEENLLEELYPKKMLHKTQFAKPAPPSKRGPRRLIK